MKNFLSRQFGNNNNSGNGIEDPAFSEIIESCGYVFVDTIKQQPEKHTYKISKGNRFYLIKFISKQNELFLKIYGDYLVGIQNEFKRLVIPRCVEDGVVNNGERYMVFEWIEGRDFCNRWSSQNKKTAGGRKIREYTVQVVLELISDLLKIDTSHMVENGSGVISPEIAVQDFSRTLEMSREEELITGELYGRAYEIKQLFEDALMHQPLMLSNGDFQFLNFIEVSPDRTALIDWDGARISCFEKEHCVALQWLLMWNNCKWQQDFLRRSIMELNLNKDIFRGVLLMLICRLGPKTEFGSEFQDISSGYVGKVLDDNEFNLIWDTG